MDEIEKEKHCRNEAEYACNTQTKKSHEKISKSARNENCDGGASTCTAKYNKEKTTTTKH